MGGLRDGLRQVYSVITLTPAIFSPTLTTLKQLGKTIKQDIISKVQKEKNYKPFPLGNGDFKTVIFDRNIPPTKKLANIAVANALASVAQPTAPSTPQMRKNSEEEDTQASIECPELISQLSISFNILCLESFKYLDKEVYESMVRQINSINQLIDTINFDDPSKEFKEFLNMEKSTMDAIEKVAILKFNQEEYPACLSLYTLLLILASKNLEYSMYMGISAQSCEKFNLALKAYNIVKENFPEATDSRLFSVECYLQMNQYQEAESEFTQAKKMIQAKDLDHDRQKFIAEIEDLIATLKR